VIRLLFFLVAFLLMIAAVVGGLYFWGVDPLAKLGLSLDKPQTEPQKPVAPAPSYVDFGLLSVPILQGGEPQGQAEIVLRLRVSADDKDAVAQQLPRLQAYFLEDMMGFLAIQLKDTRQLDIPAIRTRLRLDADRVLGSGKVREVVIENAAVRQ
jgi:flagellar protein FliL